MDPDGWMNGWMDGWIVRAHICIFVLNVVFISLKGEMLVQV